MIKQTHIQNNTNNIAMPSNPHPLSSSVGGWMRRRGSGRRSGGATATATAEDQQSISSKNGRTATYSIGRDGRRTRVSFQRSGDVLEPNLFFGCRRQRTYVRRAAGAAFIRRAVGTFFSLDVAISPNQQGGRVHPAKRGSGGGRARSQKDWAMAARQTDEDRWCCGHKTDGR